MRYLAPRVANLAAATSRYCTLLYPRLARRSPLSTRACQWPVRSRRTSSRGWFLFHQSRVFFSRLSRLFSSSQEIVCFAVLTRSSLSTISTPPFSHSFRLNFSWLPKGIQQLSSRSFALVHSFFFIYPETPLVPSWYLLANHPLTLLSSFTPPSVSCHLFSRIWSRISFAFFFFHSLFARVLLRIVLSPFSLRANPWYWHGPLFGIPIGQSLYHPRPRLWGSQHHQRIIRASLTCHSSFSGSLLQTQFAWSGSSAAAFPCPRYLKHRSRRLCLCPLLDTTLAHRGVHCNAVIRPRLPPSCCVDILGFKQSNQAILVIFLSRKRKPNRNNKP